MAPRAAGGATWSALAWLSHPVTVLALAVLLVNDHVLKQAYGSWWTGKLSDVAGLVLAPALVAVAVAAGARCARVVVPPRVVVGLSTGVVGAGFVVVKATAGGAAVASAAWSALEGPGVVLRDPADLVALPALAVAVAVAGRASRASAPTGARPAVWWVVLPVAVLATAATSAPVLQGAVEIAVVRGELVVGEGDGYRWYALRGGQKWERLPDESGEEMASAVAHAGGTLTQVCVPASPAECFRATDGVGVERSDDGGRTWRLDWSVPPEQVPALEERYSPRTADIRTHGLAVLPVEDGVQVWVANGGDGLALRDVDGSWERIGFAYERDPAPVVPLPGEPTPMRGPVPLLVLLAVGAGALTQLAGGRSRARTGRGGAWTSLVCGASAGALALAADAGAAVVEGQSIGGGFVVPAVPFLAPWCLLVAAVPLVVVGAARLGFRAGLGPSAVVALGVLLLAPARPDPRLAVLGAAAAVVTGVAVARLRGDRSGPLEDPPWPPWPPTVGL